MSNDSNSVKTNHNTVKKAGGNYHHGALREALIEAASQIVEEAGLDSFSLRAAARLAGVSPAAPAHHFGDVKGLLTAVATRGFNEFAAEIEMIDLSDRKAAITELSHAYLNFARTRPGMFRLMWKTSAVRREEPTRSDAGLRAFAALDRAVRGTTTAELTSDVALAPTLAAWCLMHGFSALAIDQSFFADDAEKQSKLVGLLDSIFKFLAVPIDV